MNIKILAVGKIKEKYHNQAIAEFVKRLSSYCSLNIIEITPAKIIAESIDEYEKYKKEEATKILSNIKDESFVVTLEIEGKMLSSEMFAEKIKEWTNSGMSEIVFVIGGANGLHSSVSQRADFKLSFSKMTFTHQIIRELLVEQIYRAFKILKNEPYHR